MIFRYFIKNFNQPVNVLYVAITNHKNEVQSYTLTELYLLKLDFLFLHLLTSQSTTKTKVKLR